jgi:hypothetical protein
VTVLLLLLLPSSSLSSSSSSYVMELGHLLTRSGLAYPEVSSKVCHDSFCQLGNSVSLPWVIYYGAYYYYWYKSESQSFRGWSLNNVKIFNYKYVLSSSTFASVWNVLMKEQVLRKYISLKRFSRDDGIVVGVLIVKERLKCWRHL